MRTDQSIINRYTVTAGLLSYPVTFPLFEQGDVAVYLSTDGGDTERALRLGDDYSVAINDGQTGGTVTLRSGVAQAGNIIAFLSNVPYTQELDLSNVATIDVNATERQLDRTTQQVQQVAEKATRHLTVPATSTRTPQEVMHSILTIADQANAYLAQVVKIRDDVLDLKNNAQTLITQTGDEQADRVELVGDAEAQEVAEVGQQWQDTVSEEGQIQLDRLAGYADVGALAEGLAAACQVWTLTKDVPAGSTIVLPNELQYIPGNHHLWLSYGGIVLSPSFFTEVGDGKAPSAEFITNVTFKAGQELMAWVIPLGKAYEVELTERIVALEEALMDLSRRVVYADVEE